MSNDNMELWDSVCETNPDSTKQVNDGRRRFTAIDAYSQIKRATSLWGPYGGKWKLTDLEIHNGPTQQLCHLTATFVYPGGEFPVANAIKHTSNKGVVDADCFKKMETDTLTKALSKLGFNADVFLGLYDDNRYVQEQREKNAPQTGVDPQTARNEYKPRAEAALAAHREMLADPANSEIASWCNAAMDDGAYADIVNYFNQGDSK